MLAAVNMIKDWSIAGYFTYSGKYFMHIQEEKKFNKQYKLYRYKEGKEQWLFWLPQKNYGELDREEQNTNNLYQILPSMYV